MYVVFYWLIPYKLKFNIVYIYKTTVKTTYNYFYNYLTHEF